MKAAIMTLALVFALAIVLPAMAQEISIPAPPKVEDLQKELTAIQNDLKAQQDQLQALGGVEAYLRTVTYKKVVDDMAISRDTIRREQDRIKEITTELEKHKDGKGKK